MPGENDSLDENVNIGSKDELLLEISDEVKPKIENKGELIEPKKENLSRQAKKKAARFDKLKQKRQESRKFKKDLAKERKKTQPKGQEISEGKLCSHSMLRQDLNKKSKARELKFLKI